MNNAGLDNVIRFFLLLVAQIVIFNKINLFGFITPYPYVLFIILYPINGNKQYLLLFSFILGILVDMFCDSGGIHATASLVLAYMRSVLVKFSFGISHNNHQTIRLNGGINLEKFIFILISITIHHFILFFLEILEFNLLYEIFIRSILSVAFTFILSIIIFYIFKPMKR